METKLPAVTQSAAPLDYSDPVIINTLKQTVARGTTDAEFALFVQQCRATGLNPFKREIWCIKTQQQLQLMTGINGYYEIANRHPQFDGIEVEVQPKGGKPEVAIAKVYRKDRARPMVAEAYMEEYGKTYGNWTKMPRLMLSKCAESMALRKAFPQELSGTYTDVEMPREYAASVTAETIEMVDPPPPPPSNGTPEPQAAPAAPAQPPSKPPAPPPMPEPSGQPDQWRLQATSKRFNGKTLDEIWKTDRAWFENCIFDPKYAAKLTPDDAANMNAFYKTMSKYAA